MNISRPPLRGLLTSETFLDNKFRNRKYKHLLSCKPFMLNSKYIFFYSWILISLNVVITKDQLSGDNKTNLVFMMKPIITRETEREQRAERADTTRGSHYFCCDFRDRVSLVLLTMTDGKIFYPAPITSQKLTLSQYSHSQI